MKLEDAIVEQLRQVIDPETGADVIRMRPIEGLEVDEETENEALAAAPECLLGGAAAEEVD